jgi:hypothetical protein
MRPFILLQIEEAGVLWLVIRRVIFLKPGNIPRAASALHAESLRNMKSLERVAELGMTRIILETYAALVAKAITSTELDRSTFGCLFRQIRNLVASYFVHCSVVVCPKACNCIAERAMGVLWNMALRYI